MMRNSASAGESAVEQRKEGRTRGRKRRVGAETPALRKQPKSPILISKPQRDLTPPSLPSPIPSVSKRKEVIFDSLLQGDPGSPWDGVQLACSEVRDLQQFQEAVNDRIASVEYDKQWIEDFQSFKTIRRAWESGKFASPPVTRVQSLPSQHRRLLLFDLDHTLVHSTARLSAGQEAISLRTGDHIIKAGVSLRPFARECIAAASDCFAVGVFTAAQRSYSEEVVRLLDPQRRFITCVLDQENCVELEGRVVLKDLRLLQTPLSDVVLVDNSLLSFALQIYNGVPVPTWTGNPDDTCLLDLMKYLKPLSLCKDVRLLNRDVFESYYRSLLDDST